MGKRWGGGCGGEGRNVGNLVEGGVVRVGVMG